jgi:hypothetical protein
MMSLLGLLAYNEGRRASGASREAAKQDQNQKPEPVASQPEGKVSRDKRPEHISTQQQGPQKRQSFHRRRLRPQLAEKRTFTETILKGPHLLSAPARHDDRPVCEAYILGFKLEALRQADLAGRERLVPSTEPSLFDTDREDFFARSSFAQGTSMTPRSLSPDRYTRYSRWPRKHRKG